VLDDGPKGQGRQEAQSTYHDDDDNEQAHEHRPVRAERARARGDVLLRGERSRQGKRGQKYPEPSDQHAHPQDHVVERAVGGEAGESAAVVARSRSERIQDLKTPYMLLDEKGEPLDSVEFAKLIEKLGSSATFLLGGAYGVSGDVKARAIKKIRLSSMTFTHEMSRLVFLEQLYRAFTILQKRGYHH